MTATALLGLAGLAGLTCDGDLSPAGVTLRARALDFLRSVDVPNSDAREHLRFDVDALGRTAAVIEGDRLRVFSLRAGEEVLCAARPGLMRAALDPSGRFAYAADNQGYILRFGPGEEPQVLNRLEGAGPVSLLRVAPSGRRLLVVTSGERGQLLVLRLPGGQRQAVVEVGAGACDASFSRSEAEVHFVTTARRAGTLRIEDRSVEDRPLPEAGLAGALILAAASPRGDRCAFLPQGAGEIRLCDPVAGRIVATLSLDRVPASLRFDPTGDWLAARVADELWFWNARSGDRARVLRLAPSQGAAARPSMGEPAFAARTGWVATAALGHVQLWGPGARPGPQRRPGFLGIEWGPDRTSRVIQRVLADTPAEQAGLRAGDVLVAVGSARVAAREEARQAILNAGAGAEVRIVVTRGGTEIAVTVRLAAPPPER